MLQPSGLDFAIRFLPQKVFQVEAHQEVAHTVASRMVDSPVPPTAAFDTGTMLEREMRHESLAPCRYTMLVRAI